VAAWEWSAGRHPLVPPDITVQRIADFEAKARPEWHGHPVDEWRDEAVRREQELRRKAAHCIQAGVGLVGAWLGMAGDSQQPENPLPRVRSSSQLVPSARQGPEQA
jgi:hypothetical protein